MQALSPSARWPLWIAAALALAYLPAWWASYQFDDYKVIVGNPVVQSWPALAADFGIGIRPLLKLGYWLSWRLGAGAPWAFVALNLGLHLAASGLVYALGRRLYALTGVAAEPARLAALLAALLFALHPAQTESVTYICGRSSAQSGLLMLAALLAYDRQLGGGPRWPAVLLWLAALASKETAAVLPLALLLWDALARPDDAWHARLRRLAPYALLLALAALLALPHSNYRDFFATSLATRSPVDNALQQIPALGWLLRGALLLRAPNIDPDLRPVAGVDAALLMPAALLLGLLLLALALRRWRWPAFCAAWALVFLLPTNSLLARLDLANDRQLYLPLAALAWSLGWALAWLARGQPASGRLLAGALLSALATLTALRNLDYRSESALWATTLLESPEKARVLSNHGAALWLSGEPGAAEAAFRAALARDPGYAPARTNLRRLTGE